MQRRVSRPMIASRIGMGLAAGAVMILGPGVQAGAQASAPPTAPPQSHPAASYGTLSPSGVVNVRHLAAAPARTRGRTAPFLTRNPVAYSRAKAQAGARPSAAAKHPQTLSVVAAPGGLSVATSFPLLSSAQQIGFFPQSDLEPPDTQVAVGPSHVVEFVNDTGTIWNKTGALLSHFDLNLFFKPANGLTVSDPQILYDAASSRWFASTMAFALDGNGNPAAGQVILAVSQTSDPTGNWFDYPSGEGSNVIFDQPFLGLNNDKVVLSWNNFNNANNFTGEDTFVFDKAEALAGTDTDVATLLVNDTSRFRLAPARALSSTTTEYLVYNNSDCTQGCTDPTNPSAGVLAVTGTPSAGNVSFVETDVKIAPTAVPPLGAQPGCAPTATCAVATNDDGFQGAVFDNGELWTAGNTTCVPRNDTNDHSCLRLVGITTGTTPTLARSSDIGEAGWDLYYPAIAPDAAGNVGLAFSQSSASVDPEVAAVAVTSNTSPLAARVLRTGQAVYQGTRWGDYSSAAVDPGNAEDWWLAGEYAATACCNGANWGTAVAEVVMGRLSFITGPPSRSVAGTSFGVTVEIKDALGNVVAVDNSTPVSLTIHSGPAGAALGCTPNPRTVTAGVATFSCQINKAGLGYTLAASAPSFATAVSSSFVIKPSSPVKLAFTTQPPAVTGPGSSFATTVGVEDRFGNLTAGSTQVTLTLHSNPTGATLACTHDPVTTSGGVARFSCSIAKVGSGYSLVATAPGLPSAISSGFTIAPAGYWLVASDGGIFTFGHLGYFGSTGAIRLNQPIVGMAATSDAKGYWLVARDGGIFRFGDARFYGSTGSITLNKPVVGMAADPATGGYWMVASDGGIFSFHAPFLGSTGAIRLNQPIVGMAVTPDSKGYWLVARDGGIFRFGDARFYGSTGNITLNKPIVGMAADPATGGYWMVASDGGIFAFRAPFYGSTGDITLNKPIVGMAADPATGGYWMVASDGGIFSFHAPFYGSTGNLTLNKPIVGMTN